MKRNICILMLCLALSACASEAHSSSEETSATTTTTATTAEANNLAPEETSEPDDSAAPKPVEKMAITAEVLSYENELLTFNYEGTEYTLPLPKKKFDNENAEGEYMCLSERIIGNDLGETVYAKMSVTKDMSEILLCDVINTNGQKYSGERVILQDEKGNSYIAKDLLYSFKRTDGSLCEISNTNETLELDLNDLPIYYKLDYPEAIDLVTFDSYKFKDSKMFLTRLGFKVILDEDTSDGDGVGVSETYGPEDYNSFGNRLNFFGVIQSISDDGETVTVLLNDKKTLCTVPTYYNDGTKLEEGMEIMVTLIADSSLFGSGGAHGFDYAVICTDAEYYNQSGEDNKYVSDERVIKDKIPFAELGYAEFEGAGNFKYTSVDNKGYEWETLEDVLARKEAEAEQ